MVCGKLYDSRRYQVPVTDTPRDTSRSIPRVYQGPYGRLLSGSKCRLGAMPKVLLLLGPISLFWAMLSRLVGNAMPEHVEVPGGDSHSRSSFACHFATALDHTEPHSPS